MRSNLLLLLFLITFFHLHAQKKIKYGKVSKEELRMEYYAKDSTAEAVILSDIGELDKQRLKFYRHLRIKILKKSGTKWGNHTFYVPTKGSIDGKVFNLEDGRIVEEKLKNSSIYEEEVIDGFVVYKVFMPNVRVGSVIDIRYQFYGVPFEWRFQDRIPIVHSELIMGDNRYFSMSSVGFMPVTTIKNGSHWEANNMPAFRPEPYMNDYSNYITKFQIELNSIFMPGNYRWVDASWERIGEYLAKHPYVGGVLKTSGFLNGFAKDMKDLDLTLDEKIDTAYAYIKANIKWNKQQSTYVYPGFRSHFLKEHSGNSAEINLLLVSLLNKMEIDAVPVAISTRDNGMLNPFIPTINKLNYIVCHVRENDKNIFLDATDDDLVPGYLPVRCINGKGRYFDDDNNGWVDLKVNSGSYHCQSMITIDQEGSEFFADITRKLSHYEYLSWKETYDDLGSVANYRSNFEKSYPGLFIDEYGVDISNEEMAATETIKLNMTEFVDDLGNEIYIPANLLMSMDNPFKMPDRKYPVDFILPRFEMQMINFQIDEDYKIVSVPETVRVILPDGGCEFLFIANVMGNTIQIQCKSNIQQTLFTSDQYSYLQDFYMQMISKLNEAIHIVKRT